MSFIKEIVPYQKKIEQKKIVPIEKKTMVIKNLIKKVFEQNRKANMKKAVRKVPVVFKRKAIKKKSCKKPTCKKSACKKWITL